MSVQVDTPLWLGGREITLANEVTMSSTEGDLIGVNLQDYRPEKKWRATGCAAEWAFIVLRKDIPINTLVAIGHNFGPDATWRVKIGPDEDSVTFGTPAIDTGFQSVWPDSGMPDEEEWPQYISFMQWENATPYNHCVLDIVDPTNPDGYVQIGRLMLDRALRPDSYRISSNLSLGLTLADAQRRTPFNRIYTERRGPPARTMGLTLGAISRRDLMDYYFTLARLYGMYDDFFFCSNPAETTDLHKLMLHGMFANAAQFETQPVWDHQAQMWRSNLSLCELV